MILRSLKSNPNQMGKFKMQNWTGIIVETCANLYRKFQVKLNVHECRQSNKKCHFINQIQHLGHVASTSTQIAKSSHVASTSHYYYLIIVVQYFENMLLIVLLEPPICVTNCVTTVRKLCYQQCYGAQKDVTTCVTIVIKTCYQCTQ